MKNKIDTWLPFEFLNIDTHYCTLSISAVSSCSVKLAGISVASSLKPALHKVHSSVELAGAAKFYTKVGEKEESKKHAFL